MAEIGNSCAGNQKEKGGNWGDKEVGPGHFSPGAQIAPWEKTGGVRGIATEPTGKYEEGK